MSRRLFFLKLRFLLLLFLIGGIFPLSLSASSQGSFYPKEMLTERIPKIAADYSVHIAFDNNLLARTEVLPLNAKPLTLEQALEQSLGATDFIYKKLSNGSYAITGKITNQGQDFGSLKGRVVEAETLEPLPGATIQVLGTQLGTTTDFNGYYHLFKIPEGKYTIRVSFIGYTKQQLDVRVQANKTETYDVTLSVDSRQLDDVVVKGVRRERGSVPHATELLVAKEIKGLNVVASGISSEQIGKSADRNAAEAVRKISGVTVRDDKFIVIRGMNERYNLTYLNGNIAPSTELYSRAFALDLIPTRIIDRIIVYKSPSPDLMADMTGGAVKIYTKDAKAVRHFDFEFQLGHRPGTSFNSNFLTYQGGKTDFLGFDDGTRALPSSVPGYGDFTKANISQKEYASSFSNVLAYGKKTALPNMQLTANYYNSFPMGRHSLSMLTSLSYKNENKIQDVDRKQGNITYDGGGQTFIMNKYAENQNVNNTQLSLLQNFVFSLNDSSKIQFKNYFLLQGQDAVVVRLTNKKLSLLNGNWEQIIFPDSYELNKDITFTYSQRFLYSGNLGGNHSSANGKHKLEWNMGYTYSRQEVPDQRVMRFKRYILRPDLEGLNGPEDLNMVASVRYISSENPDNSAQLGIGNRMWTLNSENVYNASIDYAFRVFPWATFKTGTYQQWKQRELFRRVYALYEGDRNAIGMPITDQIGGNGQYINPNLIYFREQDLYKVWSDAYLRDDGSGLKVFDRTSGSDAYKASEQNNSGYAALNLTPFNGKLDIYGGLRVEYNRQQVAGAVSGVYINKPVLVDIAKTDWLPSLNISIRPIKSLALRLAYGKTVNRPEFRELSPYSELDYLNNQTISGNTNLKPANIENYDARVEFYPANNQTGESFSMGFFYKSLTNPIERTITKDMNNPNVAQISFNNSTSATVRGLEIEVRKSFSFIPLKFFRDLSLVGNYSLMESEALLQFLYEGENLNQKRQLQGQAPYSLNLGLFYDNAGTGTKIALLYNEVGPRIYAASLGHRAHFISDYNVYDEGDLGSLIELTSHQLDIAISQRIVKSLQLKFSVQNLLNQPVRMAEDANFTYKYEKAKCISGITLEGDMIANEYYPGRYFTLSISYSF